MTQNFIHRTTENLHPLLYQVIWSLYTPSILKKYSTGIYLSTIIHSFAISCPKFREKIWIVHPFQGKRDLHYEGTMMSWGLLSLLTAFTQTQNAPQELWTRSFSIITLMIIENRALWLARSFALSRYNHRVVIITLKASSFQNGSQICWCFGVGNRSIILFSRIIIKAIILKQLVTSDDMNIGW